VKVCALRVIVPLRALPVFASTVNCTVPGPAPFAADVMWIHGKVVAAFHPHVPVALTVKDPEPPADGMGWLVGEIVTVQPLVWVTVKGCPAIVTVP